MTARWRRLAVDGIFAAKIALTAAALGSLPADAETWRFALIGDTPYSPHERAELPKMLSAIADHEVTAIVHVGDIKSGQSPCDDALFADRKALFDASRAPLVLVPGDNEWTDCERLPAGHYDPLERLAALRALFWHDDFSLGQRKLRLQRQPGNYPEHARFRIGPVLFTTLNLPGGDNDYHPQWPAGGDEFTARNPAVLAWLRDSFALAKKEKLTGIVLLFQANPGFRHFAQGLTHAGFRAFLETLRDETLKFPGQVVAVHGDTHWNRIDRPLRDRSRRPVARFTRVETFGYPTMGWTLGVIDSEAPGLFRFENHPWPGPAR